VTTIASAGPTTTPEKRHLKNFTTLAACGEVFHHGSERIIASNKFLGQRADE
jgi:hypothetical protein